MEALGLSDVMGVEASVAWDRPQVPASRARADVIYLPPTSRANRLPRGTVLLRRWPGKHLPKDLERTLLGVVHDLSGGKAHDIVALKPEIAVALPVAGRLLLRLVVGVTVALNGQVHSGAVDLASGQQVNAHLTRSRVYGVLGLQLEILNYGHRSSHRKQPRREELLGRRLAP